jgi:hypothetical protein
VQYFDETPKIVRFYTDPSASDRDDEDGGNMVDDEQHINTPTSIGLEVQRSPGLEQGNRVGPELDHNPLARTTRGGEQVIAGKQEMVDADYHVNNMGLIGQLNENRTNDVHQNLQNFNVSPHCELLLPPFYPSQLNWYLSVSQQTILSPLAISNESPASVGFFLELHPQLIPFTKNKAALIRNFIENMALWVS